MTEAERRALVALLTGTIEEFFINWSQPSVAPALAETIASKLEHEDFYYLPRTLGTEANS